MAIKQQNEDDGKYEEKEEFQSHAQIKAEDCVGWCQHKTNHILYNMDSISRVKVVKNDFVS